MTNATVIVPPTTSAVLSGFSRIEITARKVKAWGYQQNEAPLYSMSRTSEHGNVAEMPFLELAELIRSQGQKRR